jgi:hypothetical protein
LRLNITATVDIRKLKVVVEPDGGVVIASLPCAVQVVKILIHAYYRTLFIQTANGCTL